MKYSSIFLLIAALGIVGCQGPEPLTPIPSEEINYPISIYVIGDSLCHVTFSIPKVYSAWPEILQLDHDCKTGRSPYEEAGDQPPIVFPTGYDLTILSLGTNGRNDQTAEEFRVAYQGLLDRVENDVLCILPNFPQEAGIISELCANTLVAAPSDALDGMHYREYGQYSMAIRVHEWLLNYTSTP